MFVFCYDVYSSSVYAVEFTLKTYLQANIFNIYFCNALFHWLNQKACNTCLNCFDVVTVTCAQNGINRMVKHLNIVQIT